MEMEVSPLPLLEEVPPREASVAADRPGRLLRLPKDNSKEQMGFQQNQNSFSVYFRWFLYLQSISKLENLC